MPATHARYPGPADFVARVRDLFRAGIPAHARDARIIEPEKRLTETTRRAPQRAVRRAASRGDAIVHDQ